MDFEPSEEQVMISDSVDQFGARHYQPSERMRLITGGADSLERRWHEMARAGWLGLGQLADDDSNNDTYIMTLMQGFGRHLILEPFVTRCILVPALLAAAKTPTARGVLAGVANGTALAALALGEARSGFQLNWVETVAEAVEGGFRLRGEKTHVEDGADAEWFVVPARSSGTPFSDEGISLFLVHREAADLSIERFSSIDAHRHARLKLDGVRVGNDALIGELGQGLSILEPATDRAIVAHISEALGSMEAVRDVALEYIKTRHQFGKPIGSFQVLQHRMVDMDTACEEARSMVYYATKRLRGDSATRREAVSAAKARVGQCGLFVARQSIQLHGGLGVSAELIVSHHLKRQMMLDLAYGNASYHRTRFAEAVG
jgi:pimeloyl-CoA dehydrogenase